VGPNPFLGVLFHWTGGLCSASNFIPFRGIKRWSWEIYWIIQGVAAWLIAPPLLASIFVPHVFSVLSAAHASPDASLFWPIFWGLLWGIPGAVLAVPLTSAIKVVCENVKGWEGFARLLGEPDVG